VIEVPWNQFAAGTIQDPNRANNCVPLNHVAHVAHLKAGLRIVEDRQLHADLVFDQSKLNTERIRVVWLSPNDWSNAGGFRYGNVRFLFPWDLIVEGKRYFWVESIAYGVAACRILITHNRARCGGYFNEDASETSSVPKGRQRKAWGASPRKGNFKNPHEPRRGGSRPSHLKLLPPLQGLGGVGDSIFLGLTPQALCCRPFGTRALSTKFVPNLPSTPDKEIPFAGLHP